MQYIIKNYKSKNVNDFIVSDEKTNQQIDVDYSKSLILEDEIILVLKKYEVGKKYKIINKKDESFYTIATKTKTFKETKEIEDQKYFFELIKDMSTNKLPTIIQSRGASLLMQQSFYISLINYYINKNNGNTLDDLTNLVGEKEAWEQNRFNPDVLKSKKIWNGIKYLDEITSRENISLFNLLDEGRLFSSPSAYIENFNKIIEKFEINKKLT